MIPIRSKRIASRKGFSLLELVIAMAVLAVAMGAILTSMVNSVALRRTNRETFLALEAARGAIETVRGEPFQRVYTSFNANAADDPDGAGTAPGRFIAVRGLGLQANDVDGFVGEIIFPGDGVSLFENLVDVTLGTPRDLSGDNVVDAAAHNADYTLLPFEVRLAWRGASGNRELSMVTTLADL